MNVIWMNEPIKKEIKVKGKIDDFCHFWKIKQRKKQQQKTEEAD